MNGDDASFALFMEAAQECLRVTEEFAMVYVSEKAEDDVLNYQQFLDTREGYITLVGERRREISPETLSPAQRLEVNRVLALITASEERLRQQAKSFLSALQHEIKDAKNSKRITNVYTHPYDVSEPGAGLDTRQ